MTPNDFRDVRVQATGGGSLVSFDNNHKLLSGISPRQLSASNFIFNQDDAALQTRACHQLSQTTLATSWTAARKFRAVFS